MKRYSRAANKSGALEECRNGEWVWFIDHIASNIRLMADAEKRIQGWRLIAFFSSLAFLSIGIWLGYELPC